MKKYNPKIIEKKWQRIWEQKKSHFAKASAFAKATADKSQGKKQKFYALVEFPYPSGDGLHVGHCRSYTALDIISRKRRMQGKNVLFPIGWDAFGLPTENFAIKHGIHPSVATKKNTDTFRKQLKSLGFSFDWSREINTTDPAYYKWTQWIFLQLFKHGLAYKDKIAINWCPSCRIGLANEEVVAGNCERCGAKVEKREKEQWLIKITKYADRLVNDLDKVDYLEKIKIQQREWIGRSDGVEIEFRITSPSPALPEGKGDGLWGDVPGYITTDAKTWRLLQGEALRMRKNPTKAEETLWEKLKENKNYHFRRQQIIGKFIVDFVCLSKKLVVEVDGDIHDLQKEKDEERTKMLEDFGFKVIRFRNEEILDSVNVAVQKIVSEIETLPFGKGEGWAEILKVFTTRADTLFGCTFLVVAPEHEIIEKLKSKITNWQEVERYIIEAKNKSDLQRQDQKEKTGVELKGIKAINPANKKEIPIFVADYVMINYGTGAIMAVPAHDERDFEFAKKYNLEIIQVDADGSEEAKSKIIEFVGGKRAVNYKLRDWVFSRQHYWGEPIPLIFCEKCGWVAVPEKDLPVELPKVKKYEPTDTGESPLAAIEKWVNTKCPKCNGPAKRETDTMPNWAGSNWYYLAYTAPKISNFKFQISNSAKYFSQWMPVDWYNGGMEHTTLHLLYSRFIFKFLWDIGAVPKEIGNEPYAKRTSHGMVLGEGGIKMSKSKGNVINPDQVVKDFGADTLRIYEMFMGPFDQAIPWDTKGVIGSRRFLDRVYNLIFNFQFTIFNKFPNKSISQNGDLDSLVQKTIKKVSEDIEEMKFNTAVSALMILVNAFSEKPENITKNNIRDLFLLLSPFAPHLAEELWQEMKFKGLCCQQPWPEYDKKLIIAEKVLLIVQINGKVRDKIEANSGLSQAEAEKLVKESEKLRAYLEGKQIRKVIYVKDKLINIVV